MPQTKTMKIQWLNIDGRQVPLVLPQVWDDNKQDWVVTGHAAPLPMTDSAVKSELEQIKQENTEIKQTQQEILARLDAGLDTRLTGSNVELDTKVIGSKIETFTILEREVRTTSLTRVPIYNGGFLVPLDVKRVIVELIIYGITGTFAEGEGYRSNLRREIGNDYQGDDIARSKFTTNTGNYSGNLFIIDPTIVNETNFRDIHFTISDIVAPSARYLLYIEGEFGTGEGIDCEVRAHYVY